MSCRPLVGHFVLDGIVLPMPAKDNSLDLNSIKIVRQNYAYSAASWPRDLIRTYTFEVLTDELVALLLSLYQEKLGLFVTFTDHYGDEYTGILQEPNPVVEEERDCLFNQEIKILCLEI